MKSETAAEIQWSDLPPCPRGVDEETPWPPARTVAAIDELEAAAVVGGDARGFVRRELGHSVEGRRIDWVQVGRGPIRVMAWARMHGNEPTHTGVVVRLLRFLLESDHPAAADVLEACTLGLIPMVNPDGSERKIRYNAQGVDLNRDARDFATPEARLLRDAAIEFDPEFAFNLHNQDHRKSTTPNHGPISAALLVPPRMDGDEQHAAFVLARRLASVVHDAVAPNSEGGITRYAMDYTPTAFGEWFQSRGVATVLLESGALDRDGRPPQEDVHLFAMLRALHAIASGAVAEQDTASYDALKTPAETPLHDVLLRRIVVPSHTAAHGLTADVGVRFPKRSAAAPTETSGLIEAIGDLRDQGALHFEPEVEGCVCLPGRIGVWGTGHLDAMPVDADWERALASGFTTILSPIDLTETEPTGTDDAPALGRLGVARRPVNVGLIGVCDVLDNESLLVAMENSVVAVACDRVAPAVRAACNGIGIPLIDRSFLPLVTDAPLPEEGDWIRDVADAAERLGLDGRGAIDLDAVADLVLLDAAGSNSESRLRRVYVAGSLTWTDGRLTRGRGGVLLRGSWGSR